MNNIICRCRHLREEHCEVEQLPLVVLGILSLCQHKINQGIVIDCNCDGYTPDNLMHIEILAKKTRFSVRN